MKKRILWLVVIVASIAGFYFFMVKPALTPAPMPKQSTLTDLRPALPPPPELPMPVIVPPEITLPAPTPAAMATTTRRAAPLPIEVPIQNGATIDFSTGAPHVRSVGDDKAALDRALREMAEATKDVTFPPSKK